MPAPDGDRCNLGRYAELFDFDAGRRRFILPDAQEEEIAANEEVQ